MINFLDTINRYGEEYAYVNMAEAILENEDKIGVDLISKGYES